MTFLGPFLNELHTLASDGGWVFYALIVLAFGISFALISLWQSTHLPDAPLISSRDWVVLLRNKPGSDTIRSRLQKKLSDSGDMRRNLDETHQRLFSRADRRFPFTFIIIGAAPLIGLLGTVSGMFTTFRGMSSSSASAPIDIISEGISEALITTQTGLTIGIPAYILCALLKSRHDILNVRFRQLESQLLQQAPG